MSMLLSRIIETIKPLHEKAMTKARARQDQLTKPRGSLGKLEELSVKIAGITGKEIPRIEQKAIVTMAADHGVTAEAVSAYPKEVTGEMVSNFLRGGAGINVLARHIGARRQKKVCAHQASHVCQNWLYKRPYWNCLRVAGRTQDPDHSVPDKPDWRNNLTRQQHRWVVPTPSG